MRPKNKIIRDLVHGYIEIDEFIEKIINTYNFQRLKDIRQLTAHHVYPSATHNRFEHSLGVMHLAEQSFNPLRMLLVDEYKKSNQEVNSLFLHFKVAALLHDIGHAPFSHLGEIYFPKRDLLSSAIKNVIQTKHYMDIDSTIFSINAAKHELMSCYVIITKFYPLLSGEFKNLGIDLNLELICRAILGCVYKDKEHWAENIIIQLLNSNTLDIDKLDYLIRDAYMTGINVPTIDTARLFKSIYINPKTRNITFTPKALPVIQSIVEARDSMYLWVYNHHITVYTDFLIQYYIKHLISNYEKAIEKGEEKFRDQMNPQDFFSPEAISNRLVSDSDLWSLLKRPWFPNGDEEISQYTRVILPQLCERRFLKPLWKTIYEFRHFMLDKVKDDTLRSDVIEKLGDPINSEFRVYAVEQLCKECKLRLGEIFIVPRSNKFYSLNPKNIFTVYINESEKNIDTLLPQKNYGELYEKVAFYVLCRREKKDEVRDAFIKIINQPLPSEDDVKGKGTRMKWQI